MGIEELQLLTQKEQEMFKTVCNELLSNTFVVRTLYQQGKGRVQNPKYTFLSVHFTLVQEYLSFLDWELRKDEFNGYFYVLHKNEVNRRTLNKTETAILLALRMIYQDNQEQIGLEQDAYCTVREVLEKIVTEYPILSAKPNMEEVKKALTVFEKYQIIQKIEGKYHQADAKLSILPTILTVVSAEKLQAVASMLRKENELEETEENSAD